MELALQHLIILGMGIIFIGILGSMASGIVTKGNAEVERSTPSESIISINTMVRDAQTEGTFIVWFPKGTSKARIICGTDAKNYIDVDLDLDNDEYQSSKMVSMGGKCSASYYVSNIGTKKRVDICKTNTECGCDTSSYYLPSSFRVIDLGTTSLYSINQLAKDTDEINAVYIDTSSC